MSKKMFKLYINGKQPRSNSKELKESKIIRYSEQIIENISVGETFIFRPLTYIENKDSCPKEYVKSYHNKEMLFEKKEVELLDDINSRVTAIISIYLKEL